MIPRDPPEVCMVYGRAVSWHGCGARMAVDKMPSDRRPTIALAVSAGIAAYKAVEVARLLIKAGARVIPLMTRNAQRFIGPLTLSGICGVEVRTEMFDPSFPGEMHVQI